MIPQDLGKKLIGIKEPRIGKLNKKERGQYEKTMEEAMLFFDNENISEEDKQKLLLAINEMFFMSKQRKI